MEDWESKERQISKPNENADGKPVRQTIIVDQHVEFLKRIVAQNDFG